jgi:hypothetical protein
MPIFKKSVPLQKLSGNAQIADLHSGAGLFAAVAGLLFAGIKAVGTKKEERREFSQLSRPHPQDIAPSQLYRRLNYRRQILNQLNRGERISLHHSLSPAPCPVTEFIRS